MRVDSLSRTLSALADPTRRAILARLTQSDASVAELAQPFNIGVRAVSKHIGVLDRAGLVSRARDAQRRPSRIQLAPLKAVDDWLGMYRRLWEGRLDNIADVLTRIKKGEIDDSRD
jgi:DNA-binding transcriptional ArsR family regulator